jgi:hypothetical protein
LLRTETEKESNALFIKIGKVVGSPDFQQFEALFFIRSASGTELCLQYMEAAALHGIPKQYYKNTRRVKAYAVFVILCIIDYYPEYVEKVDGAI